MKYRTRIYYTETDKALMWKRWRQGESLQAIAELFDRNHSAIGGILARTGGIRPLPRTEERPIYQPRTQAPIGTKTGSTSLAVKLLILRFSEIAPLNIGRLPV
jgi:hypothetical protein